MQEQSPAYSQKYSTIKSRGFEVPTDVPEAPIALSVGSWSCHVGFAGDERPRRVFPQSDQDTLWTSQTVC